MFICLFVGGISSPGATDHSPGKAPWWMALFVVDAGSKDLFYVCPLLQVNRLRYQSTQGHLKIAFLTSSVKTGQCLGERDLPTSTDFAAARALTGLGHECFMTRKARRWSHNLPLFHSKLPIIFFFLFSRWADKHGKRSGYRDEACLFNLCLSLKCCLVTP